MSLLNAEAIASSPTRADPDARPSSGTLGDRELDRRARDNTVPERLCGDRAGRLTASDRGRAHCRHHGQADVHPRREHRAGQAIDARAVSLNAAGCGALFQRELSRDYGAFEYSAPSLGSRCRPGSDGGITIVMRAASQPS